ncbi:GDSL-type esterase/lipase family protein [Serratia sp. DD3]|uniref:GDSL-type esterase/lipase family protein n=1 Tax=Serratia sp. DD3 TaxID=1410619 RepID=UPI0004D37543|nr:GDSL-type esterase/lipase family protein [Serratia sp. DD3]KEY58921.1 F5/8 type C domain protein [Serratia sp. DD3]
MKSHISKLVKIFPLALFLLGVQHLHAEPLRVMALGDSVTAGFSTHNYRAQLAQQARSVACDIDWVGAFGDTLPSVVSRHSAIWGVTAATVNTSYINTWMDTARPDVVLMMLGANDIQALRIAPNVVLNSLSSIIVKIRNKNPESKIFLGRYPNIRPDIPSMKVFNDSIAEFASKSDVIFVDHSVDFNIAVGSDHVDATHPNANGDAKYAYNWFKAMVKHGICDNSPVLSNVAKDKPVSANATRFGYGNPFLAVNDIVNATGWQRHASNSSDETLEIDLQGNYSLKYFELYQHNLAVYNTKTYRIDISNDRHNWETIVTEDDSPVGRNTHKIDPIEARYVRLVLLPPFGAGIISVREFRVMGTPIAIGEETQ